MDIPAVQAAFGLLDLDLLPLRMGLALAKQPLCDPVGLSSCLHIAQGFLELCVVLNDFAYGCNAGLTLVQLSVHLLEAKESKGCAHTLIIREKRRIYIAP